MLASGDSLFLGNRSGTVDGGWGQWKFFRTPENQTHLQQATPRQFVTALLNVVVDARGFIESTALSESRLQIPAEPLLADAARASLLLARATYTDLHPHYGIGSSYWAQANDGFPPTTLAMARTLCAVGAPSAAADRLGYFLKNLVNGSTGAVIYYGALPRFYRVFLSLVSYTSCAPCLRISLSRFCDSARLLGMQARPSASMVSSCKRRRPLSQEWRVYRQAQGAHGCRITETHSVG